MNSFTDPYSPRGNEPILASHIRSHTRAIRELQAKLAPFRKAKRSVKRPFHFQGIGGGVPVEGVYKVTVRGGYVLNRVVSSGINSVERVIPEVSIEGSFEPLPPEETVELELTASQAVFVMVSTDDMDVFSGAPPVQIVVASASQSSVQAQPIDDENPTGTDGEYYYPILTLEVDDDDIATVKQIQQGGPIVHDPLLWSGENVGDGKEIYKGRDTETNRYQFRTIRERASDPQIQVKLQETLGEKADELTVEGNEYDNENGGFVTVQRVVDGLVTSFTDEPFGATVDVVVPDACGLGYYTLVFSKGLLQSADFTAL